MKRIYQILAFAAVVALPFSCDKAEELAPEKPETPDVPETVIPEPSAGMSFKALTESAGTKTTIDLSDGSVKWAVGDAVKFIYELDGTAADAVSAELSDGDINGGEATFTAAVPEDFKLTEADYKAGGGKSIHMYAVYPSSVEYDYSSNPTLYVTVPSTQDGSFGSASIALAKWDKENPSGALEFKNLCGLLQVVVEDDAVKSIVLSSNENIAGKMNIGFNDGAPYVKAVSAGATSITANISGAGTYYLAVLPNDITGLYVAMYDGADGTGNLIGDKASDNTLSVARRQIRRLGTIATGFSDRFYVKADGTGDGSSWSDAAPYSKLATMLKNLNESKNIYIAGGTYTATEISPGNDKMTSSATYVNILGGYPSDRAEGYSIAGRDPETNAVILDAKSSNRIWVLQRGHWTIDGITFKNAKRTSNDTGSALVLEATNAASTYTSFTVKNCKFLGNSNTGTAGGGAVRISANNAAISLTNCTFSDNSSSAGGGAVYVNTGAPAFTNCTFSDNHGTNGGVFYINSTSSLKASNCTFSKNYATTNSGAIHFQALSSTSSLITDCSFIGNYTSATSAGDNVGNGSAIGSAGTGSNGIVAIDKCLFKGNKAAYKGAVWSRSVDYRITDSDFIDNTTKGSDYHGSAIFIDRAYKVYCNGCYFSYTSESCDSDGAFTGTGITVAVGTGSNASVLGLSNCVFAGSWGSKAQQQLMIQNTASKATIVNSTMFGQISSGNIRNYGTCNIINSIVVNAASSGDGYTANNDSGSYFNCYYSYYNKLNGTTTEDIKNSLSGVKVFTNSGANTNFANGWYVTNAKSQYANNQTTTKATSDKREYINYYAWSNAPTNGEFTKAQLGNTSAESTVAYLVEHADADFYSWLNTNGYLSVDIRGEARNTAAMWPGSYEQVSSVSSAPSFTLK